MSIAVTIVCSVIALISRRLVWRNDLMTSAPSPTASCQTRRSRRPTPKLQEDNIGAVILGDYLQLKEGDDVRRTARVLEVPVGPELVGRVVDALGRAIDGQGDISAKNTRKVESNAPGIIVRQPVRE